MCWINPGPAGNHLSGFSVKMQGKTKVGRGLPEHCVLTGSGEVSACLPAVLVEKTPLAGSSSLQPVPASMACSMCLGFPHGNKVTDRNHTPGFFAPRPGVHHCERGWVSFLVSWPGRHQANLPALHGGWSGVCSAVLFCLHGSIMHSQNNPAQLTASFPC